jgi:hypothetical protein
MLIKLAERRRSVLGLIGLGTALVLVVSIWLLIGDLVPAGMREGFLVGGLVAVAGFGFALWRSLRNPGSASTAERAITGGGDERDQAVLTRSLAITGLLVIPMTGAAAIALAAGAPTGVTMAVLLWAQLAVVIGAFVVINKRS